MLVAGLFVATSSPLPPLQPADGDASPEGTNEDGSDEFGGEQDTPVLPQELSRLNQDSISVSDHINFLIQTPPVTQGGFRPGVPQERGGGGSGGGNGADSGDDNDDNGLPLPIFDALVRVLPDPVPSVGLDVEAFGITNASSASRASFSLFGPGCPLEAGVPCAVESDSTELSPSSLDTVLQVDLCKTLCEEYSVLFSGDNFDQAGEHQVQVTFFDSNDKIVVIRDANFRVHSFFVIPESQLGAIALILSSLGTLVAMYFIKFRRS